ncbi:hypothetical protein [Facklamia sp. 7083-14-GEN3]|uniref:hypothetical protein n=1 Tax=Facklamia sp. 7083-14-GEN3 TaxID=2973478 RepID=UPI00215D1D0C|nr:hypothetical protein [Facklamia sp. 7083-14-GEN3]MCR8969594.1 hypothetical protein [Facklamia sp. 7083-14-GEN3]
MKFKEDVKDLIRLCIKFPNDHKKCLSDELSLLEDIDLIDEIYISDCLKEMIDEGRLKSKNTSINRNTIISIKDVELLKK